MPKNKTMAPKGGRDRAVFGKNQQCLEPNSSSTPKAKKMGGDPGWKR